MHAVVGREVRILRATAAAHFVLSVALVRMRVPPRPLGLPGGLEKRALWNQGTNREIVSDCFWLVLGLAWVIWRRKASTTDHCKPLLIVVSHY